MTTRRRFLTTLAVPAAAALARRAGAASVKPPLGLQLYSLRAQLAKDVPGTLAQVKAWGIDEVEGFGAYGAAIAGELVRAGLRCRAIHVGYEELGKDVSRVLAGAETLGAGTIVNPSLPYDRAKGPRASREEILRAASDFTKWSRACRAAGKRFAYHVHGQEFAPDGAGGTLFDVLAKESGPDVGFEADVYWVTAGGADPVPLMGRYPGRFWFTHLKDMAKTAPAGARRENEVLGTGSIDIAGIVAAGAAAGVEVHYIEDESAAVLEQVPRSIAWYRSL